MRNYKAFIISVLLIGVNAIPMAAHAQERTDLFPKSSLPEKPPVPSYSVPEKGENRSVTNQSSTFDYYGLTLTLDESGTLHIPAGTIVNPESYSLMNAVNGEVKKIDFEGPLKINGSAAQFLGGFRNLTTIENMANLDTSGVTDMEGMFAVDESLTSLDLSSFDTQNVTDMNGMFFMTSSLTSLDLSSFDTQNVTNMYAMFAEASSLTNLDVSSFDTQNVTNMREMFYDTSSLTSLDVSHFNTQNVTDMSLMFEEASSLTSLDVSYFDTQNVTDMGGMFAGLKSLTSLDVSHFDTQNVTDMGGMFARLSSLTSLDVTHFNTQNVTDMGGMFAGLKSLTSLDVSHFDTQNVTEMGSMFTGLSSLTSLDVSSFDTQNVTAMDYMFAGLSSLTSLDVSHFDTQNVTDIYGYGGMRGMFIADSSLTTLDLSSFAPKNGVSTSWMFFGCENLKRLDISSLKNSESDPDDPDKEVNLMFFDTPKLQEISFGKDYKFYKGSEDDVIKDLPDSSSFIESFQNNYGIDISHLNPDYQSLVGLNIVDAALPTPVANTNYTGKWQNVGSGSKENPEGKNIWSSVDFQNNYNGTNDADTYVWQPVSKPTILAKTQVVYRLYNPNTGEHFYPTSTYERDYVIKAGWRNEGTLETAPTSGTAIYRVYNPNAKGGDHYYTTSQYEAKSLVSKGWRWDNNAKPVFYSGGSKPVYVAYNPNAVTGAHNYTMSSYEQNSLLKIGWKYGATAWFAVK